MADKKLSEKLCIFLLRKGFTIKSLTGCCFDMLARKGSRILLLKVLADANAISKEYAEQMKKLSRYIGASPLIIAERVGHALEDNVVYSRHGVYALSFSTFRNSIENRLPYIISSNAGLTASIIGDSFRKMREEHGFSFSDLSKKVGVSARMITKYDNGSQITIRKAEKLYELFGHNIFDKINVFSQSMQGNLQFAHGRETPITIKYSELGFDASETKRVPFNVIAKKEDEVILTEVGDRVNPNSASLSKLLDADNLVIFNRKKPKDNDIPSIAKSEFMEFEESKELIRFLREF